jgi:hypothetical protein
LDDGEAPRVENVQVSSELMLDQERNLLYVIEAETFVSRTVSLIY